MVKNLSTLFSKTSSSSSSSSSELTESTKASLGQPSAIVCAPDRKVSNASILTTSTVSSNSSDSSYSAKMSKASFVHAKISEDPETANFSCAHRRSCGSIDLTALLGRAGVVGLLDRADQDARIKNQLLRKHASSTQLEWHAAPGAQRSAEPNIKIVMNCEEEEAHKANSLNSSQLESKLRANASSLRCDSRQYRSNSCSGGALAMSPTIVNNYLSVPEQGVSLAKNRKTSASSILDKANRYELDMLQAKFCANCYAESECRFFLSDNQSTNSANSNNQSNNASSSNICFEFLSSESLANEREAESACSLKSHILNSHTSAGINLTKSAADILLANVNFKGDSLTIGHNFSKLVSWCCFFGSCLLCDQ
ncbi:hypothetical protein BpHYR1_009609 [Brachionus plicatilis]|uniref:Uncharacterized protein n=1 Tax=Brachionus plicatilis TaxID=10195 RepID=A0A3M7T662_BRAPC|nr:hypothetical protein BpHYR1_009609 [Brachionus plicatilis]